MEWSQLDEQFLQRPDQPVVENRAAKAKKWKHWVGGTYQFSYPADGECSAKVTLNINWDDPDSIRWIVDTTTADAAYPGVHRGSILHSDSEPDKVKLEWKTPILSPYVRVEKGDGPLVYLPSGTWEVAPAVGSSSVTLRDSSVKTTIIGGKKQVGVMVLQNVMKGVCNILVHGPRLPDVPQEFASSVQLEFMHGFSSKDIAHLIRSFFEKEASLRKPASFFSRAYNAAEHAEEGREVTDPERQSTIESVICLFEHFNILQEPPWVEEDDWVENLSGDLRKVRGFGSWQKMERKWATLASYACGLKLHHGPWAGPDWEQYAI